MFHWHRSLYQGAKLAAAIFVTVLVLTGAVPAAAQQVATESQIKTAFVFNFLKFITRPETAFFDANSPLEFCMVSGETLSGELLGLDGAVATGRTVRVREVSPSPEGNFSVAGCHVLYLGTQGTQLIQDAVLLELSQDTLTIGDVPGFAEAGGMVNFFEFEQRVRFEINIEVVNSSSLRFSPELLSLARIIGGGAE